jgi:hypothetical protein
LGGNVFLQNRHEFGGDGNIALGQQDLQRGIDKI